MLGTSVMSAKAAYAIGQSGSMEGPLGKGAEIFSVFSSAYARERREAMSLADFLDGCRNDPGMTASAAERMIAAIGEPNVVDTAKDQRLGRIFFNRTIKLYPTLSGFFGMEDTIQRIVGYFQHAAQGLEERKQILYLLGPVGGGKSSLAERLKELMETQPIYVLAAGDEISPVFESPLGLFRPETMGAVLESRYGIPARRLTGVCSPWAVKRLDEFDGDISRFDVVKIYPSRSCARSPSPRPSPATRTTRTSRPWSARSTSASSSISARTIRTPIPFRAGSAARSRACSNSSKCSRRRSRCCIRC